jgi:Porin PorA
VIGDEGAGNDEEAALRNVIGMVLTGLGAFLLITAVLVRFYVAPRLIAAPTDVYQVTRLRAENATYFDAKSAKQVTGATIVATNTVRGDVTSSHGDTAVWDSATVIQDVTRGTTVEIQNQRVAFDRRTGLFTGCCGASVDGDVSARQSGVGLFWPVHATKKAKPVYDPATRRAWPAVYAGKERVHGVEAWRFVQHVPYTKVQGQDLPDVPGELLGRAKGSPSVPVDRYYQAEGIYWVDPRTGNPIDQEQKVLSTLQPRSGPGRLVVGQMDLRMTPESQKALRDKSADGATKINLLRIAAPVGSAAVGVLLLAAGAVVGRAGRRRPPRSRQPGEPLATTR